MIQLETQMSSLVLLVAFLHTTLANPQQNYSCLLWNIHLNPCRIILGIVKLSIVIIFRRECYAIDIIEFRKTKKTEWPNLCKLARDILCTPATSAAVEKLFSTISLILTAKRSTIHSCKIDMISFIHDNYDIIKKILYMNSDIRFSYFLLRRVSDIWFIFMIKCNFV